MSSLHGGLFEITLTVPLINHNLKYLFLSQDDTSKILEEKAREAGVNVVYQSSEHPTGRCAVLITGQDR